MFFFACCGGFTQERFPVLATIDFEIEEITGEALSVRKNLLVT